VIRQKWTYQQWLKLRKWTRHFQNARRMAHCLSTLFVAVMHKHFIRLVFNGITNPEMIFSQKNVFSMYYLFIIYFKCIIIFPCTDTRPSIVNTAMPLPHRVKEIMKTNELYSLHHWATKHLSELQIKRLLITNCMSYKLSIEQHLTWQKLNSSFQNSVTETDMNRNGVKVVTSCEPCITFQF